MTYRSDHDAALARIDALEAENARLVAALKDRDESTPPAKPPASRAWLHVLVLIPIVVGMGAAIYALTTGRFATQPSYSPRDEELHRCAFSLAASGPVGRSMTLERVMDSTGCRELIRNRLDTARLRFDERNALEHWRSTEDVLATKVWVLTTFYKNHRADDPGADELWTEYNVAFDARQAALSEWLAVQ